MMGIGYVVGIAFIFGAIVGLILSFTAIRFAMVLPHFGAPKQVKVKKEKEVKPKRRGWDPRLMEHPTYSVPYAGGPGPMMSDDIEYESPSDYVGDPVDPRKEAKK